MEDKKRQASRRKYHYIYKTTCLITSKFYIGIHSTDNLNDGYQGSGKRLWYSINKYGKENHKTKILEFLDSRKKLKTREAEIVNNELINEELCMNIALGGGGGFIDEKHMIKCSSAGINKLKELFKDNNWKKEFSKKISNTQKQRIKEGTWVNPNKGHWEGRKQLDETKKKISESNKGKGVSINNSQYGTCWITNDVESKKIYKGDMIPEGWRLGRKMK